eukprot:TRINITY_DN16650_c0_g2_i1.p1 TRINITY_DN16650_c0_g2~~TRINITY_DN16650_c0_g2_i1.p1  ORF type:complete len:151 (-),score=17.42 TRINITY_DN16650_c0_g2_i1:76-528(-)
MSFVSPDFTPLTIKKTPIAPSAIPIPQKAQRQSLTEPKTPLRDPKTPTSPQKKPLPTYDSINPKAFLKVSQLIKEKIISAPKNTQYEPSINERKISHQSPFAIIVNPMYSASVSYTHLTLPTILLVQISVVAVSLKKKNQHISHPTLSNT